MKTHHGTATGPTFYDVAEVAEMLKMSRMTVYRAVRSGELRSVRIRGRILIPAKVIEELVAGPDESDLEVPTAPLARFGGSR